MTVAILILTAGILYAASMLRAGFGRTTDAKKRSAFMLASIGFAAHTAALALRLAETAKVPIGTSYELIEAIAWILVGLQLSISAALNIGLAGVFSMLPAAVLTLLPLACPMFVIKMADAPKQTASFASIHGILAAVSYAALAAAAIFSAMYLSQKKSLRDKSSDISTGALPSLETLEKWMGAMLGTSAAAMFIAVIVGAVSAQYVPAGEHLTFKYAVGGAIFAFQSALYALAASGAARGARLAKLSILLFALALILLIPIELEMTIK